MTDRASSLPPDALSLANAKCGCGKDATRVKVTDTSMHGVLENLYTYCCDEHPEGYTQPGGDGQ